MSITLIEKIHRRGCFAIPPGAQVVLGLDHANYGHMAVLPEAVRAELAKDFG